MPLDESELDAAVEAMYSHYVRLAHDAVERTAFDSASLVTIFRRLQRESETAQVLVVASYLEDGFLRILQNTLNDVDTTASRDRIFSGTGPLATFSNRIVMSYHLGWMRRQTVDKLNGFRKVRNLFAHEAFKVTYADQNVRDLFSSLLVQLEKFDSTGVAAVAKGNENSSVRRLSSLTIQEKFLANMALLVGEVFEDLLLMSSAQRFQVDPGSITRDIDSAPTVVKQLRNNTIRAALEVFARY